ncbi:hypothetical protein AMTR_s00130p00045740 [Amborella trichopoda]|uniref:Uncharacterized protein n=1 Tax=Amborella trichopoda TaxID=13333 RepID=W1NRI7_AMBTC|nr:hypothetical protein AMTR_s00130p00045740 [Amborella trichopoda]
MVFEENDELGDMFESDNATEVEGERGEVEESSSTPLWRYVTIVGGNTERVVVVETGNVISTVRKALILVHMLVCGPICWVFVVGRGPREYYGVLKSRGISMRLYHVRNQKLIYNMGLKNAQRVGKRHKWMYHCSLWCRNHLILEKG